MVYTLSTERDVCECRPLTDDIDADLLDCWQTVVRHAPDTPVFARPEWVLQAVRSGVTRQAALLVAYQAGVPIGMLPVQPVIPGYWQALMPFSMSGAALAARPGMTETVWTHVAAWLRARGGPGLLTAELSAVGPPLPAGLAVGRHAVPPNLRVPLGESWEAFVARRGRSTRRKLNTLAARLHDGIPGLSIDIITREAEAPAAMDTLISLYRRRWADQVGGSPLCTGCNAHFLREAMRWAVSRGYGIIPVIRYHGRPIALGTVLAIPGQQTAYYHFTVRDPAGEVPALVNSPGTALAVVVAQWAIAHGYQTLDMGRGSAGYKQLLGGEPCGQERLSLATSPLAAAVLPRLARAGYLLQRLPLHIGYHAGRWLRRPEPVVEEALAE
jgi:CelD/BcsL family acetyltransferase involved in cellulose biosynthesis